MAPVAPVRCGVGALDMELLSYPAHGMRPAVHVVSAPPQRCCPSGIMWHADPLPAACCSSFTPPHPRNPADGSLFMATPVDPLFLLLPLLERSRNRVRMQDSPPGGGYMSLTL